MILTYLSYLGLCLLIGGIIYGADRLQKYNDSIEYDEREDGSIYRVDKNAKK